MKLLHIALSLLALTPATAFATTFADDVTSSVPVFYADLDLRSEAGVKVLDRRLARAVRAVCGENEGTVVLARRLAAQHCLRAKRVEVTALRNRAIARYSSRDALASR